MAEAEGLREPWGEDMLEECQECDDENNDEGDPTTEWPGNNAIAISASFNPVRFCIDFPTIFRVGFKGFSGVFNSVLKAFLSVCVGAFAVPRAKTTYV